MEKDLNTTLLLRESNKFILTPKGQIVYNLAQQIFAKIEKAKGELHPIIERQSRLNIGINHRYERIITPLIEKFILTKPDFTVNSIVDDGGKIREGFTNGDYDLIFTINFDSKEHPSFNTQGDSIFLFEDQISLCCHKNHPILKQKKLNLKKLADYPFIVSANLEDLLRHEFIDNHLPLNIAATFNRSAQISSLLKTDDYLGVLAIHSLTAQERSELSFPQFSILNAHFLFVVMFNERSELGLPYGRELFRNFLLENKKL